MRTTKRCKMKKGGVITFHKSQNSEYMQDHEIAIHDGNLKLISENHSQASNKAMNRERELIPQSQSFISNCLSWTNSLWLAQAAWKEKFGLSYELSLSGQCFTAGCGNNESPNFSPNYTTTPVILIWCKYMKYISFIMSTYVSLCQPGRTKIL